MEIRTLLMILIVPALLLAGCTTQEAQVPVPDPDDIDTPEINPPGVDAETPEVVGDSGDIDAELPEVETQGEFDIQIPEFEWIEGDFNVTWPDFELVGGNFDINQTSDEGRVIFAVTAERAEYERVSSVHVDFDGTHALHESGDWEEIWMFEERVDLLELGAEERTELISDDWDDAGQYQMIRFDISEAEVDDHLGVSEAFLTNEEYVANIPFTVTAGQTTLIVMDFDVAQSVRLANRGTADERYVFAPVFTARVYEDAQVSEAEGAEGDTIRVSGQPTRVSETVGSTTEGDIVAGVPIAWNADITLDAQTRNLTVTAPADIDADIDVNQNVRGG